MAAVSVLGNILASKVQAKAYNSRNKSKSASKSRWCSGKKAK